MARWRIEHDVLVAGPLQLAVQRIGLSHWKPRARLRSWGIVPLHPDHDAILVPCGAGEALWIGAWREDGGTASVSLRDPATGSAAQIALPADDQLTALEDASRGARPLTADGASGPQGHPPRVLELRIAFDAAVATARLVLVAPDDWAARAGRPAPPPRTAPPPRPPRLG